MFDKIVFISDRLATIKLKDSENITMNLMNLHIVFEDDLKKILAEVQDVNGDTVSASFLGEIVDGKFVGGTIRKPQLNAKIRVINEDEIKLITGKDDKGYMLLGNTPFYDGKSVYLDINNFFSGHFAIMGNSGSGKSCGVSRLFQNMFNDSRLNPCNANIIMIDSSGEYYNAFSNLNTINPRYHYRFITSNEKDTGSEKLRIPIYLLNVDDLALLLQVTSHSQLPIIERMRKLALVFSQKDGNAVQYKNHLIAKAIMTILYSNESGPNKRNEIFSVLASCSTPQFNLETVIQGLGYTRKFRECFLMDKNGNFSESVLITEYVSSFIDDKLDSYEPKDGVFYTLDTLEKALNFTLISEGWLRNKNTYSDAIALKVRLHSLIVSSNAKFFDVKQYLTVEEYLGTLVSGDGYKYQVVNINLDDVDDSFAKVITKIYSRLIFDYSKGLTERAVNPFHLVIEEAHRYIQNDNDRFLIGYNIFERIAKEGRKYGVILGIITQRPVELSDTVISQCSNFLIFKMNHPVDVEYIRKMVPNISDEIVEKQKTLQAGTCLAFGNAFKIPLLVRMTVPDPAPWSGNCDVVSFWRGEFLGEAIDSNHSVNVSTLVPNSVFSPLNDFTPPTEINVENSMDKPLVEISEDTSMHAGSFGLFEAANGNVDDKIDEIKVPTTDTGISLVSFVSEGNSTAEVEQQNEGLAREENTVTAVETPVNTVNLPSIPVIEPSVNTVDFPQIPAADLPVNTVNFQQIAVDDKPLNPEGTVPPLVSFMQESSEQNVVKPPMSSLDNNPINQLVSFNVPNEQNVGLASAVNNPNQVVQSNSSSFLTANNSEPAKEVNNSVFNVVAAPEVNTNLFEKTGTGDVAEGQMSSNVLFSNNEPSNVVSESSLLNFNDGMNALGANLVDFTNNSTSNLVNPIVNNMDIKMFVDDTIAVPTGMEFGGDSKPPADVNNEQFNVGTSLISFLDQMQ